MHPGVMKFPGPQGRAVSGGIVTLMAHLASTLHAGKLGDPLAGGLALSLDFVKNLTIYFNVRPFFAECLPEGMTC